MYNPKPGEWTGCEMLDADPGQLVDPIECPASLLNAAQVGTWKVDMETGLATWDAVTSNLFGMPTISHAIGTLLPVHELDRERLHASLYECFREGVAHDMDFRAIRSDGSLVRLHALARPIEEETGKKRYVGGILFDVTDRREAQLPLRERERQFQGIVDNLPGMVYRCDVAPPWHVHFVSEAVRWLTGYEPDSFRRGELGWQDIILEEDQQHVIDVVDQALAAGARYDVEYRIVRKDGEIRWVQERGSAVCSQGGELLYLEGFIGDMHPQKLAEQELRGSKDLLQSVIDGVSDHICVRDREGRLILSNRALRQARNLRPGCREDNILQAPSKDDEMILAGEAQRSLEETLRVEGEQRLFHTLKMPWISGGEVTGIIGVSRDVTEQRLASIALEESEALNRSIVEASADCICLLELTGRIVFMNSAGLRALGFDEANQIVGTHWLQFWPPEVRRQAERALGTACAGGIARFSEVLRGARGSYTWWDVVVSPVLGHTGDIVRLVTFARDVTQQKSSEEKLHWTANHDGLTCLPNRSYFQKQLGMDLLAAEQEGTKLALLHLDLDCFKEINDTLGHDAGDALLKTFAQRLKACVRSSDTVARLGGDEFAVIIPGLQRLEDAKAIGETILARMREPFVHAGRILDCRASIGTSIYPEHGSTPDALLKSADIAMYMAKARGRGQMTTFAPEMHAEVHERSTMIAVAREAVGNDRIAPFYQPKIDFRNGGVVGFEALLRWRNASGVFRPPGQINAAFDDLDLATAISEKMVRMTIADMRNWLQDGVNFGHVAVNAAAAEFRQDDFAERVLEELRKAEVPISCFQLEVTETVFLGRGAEYVDRALKLLSAEGMTIALDDFGTGYASLRHLKQFPVDILKIDQSFVRDLQNPDDAAIIQAVIKLGRELQIKTVAEGIETPDQAHYLWQSGCDYGQGHLYSKAVPANGIPTLLRTWNRASGNASAYDEVSARSCTKEIYTK